MNPAPPPRGRGLIPLDHPRVQEINLFLDPLLIAPYRALDNPVWAWWLGTLVLAAYAVALGELTLALGRRLNRRSLAEHAGQAQDLQDKSLAALQAGDKGVYKLLNKAANQAFGRSFFLRAALGASSLWPAFLAAGWLQIRFAGLVVPLPGLGWGAGWLQGFLVCYLGLRLGLALLRRRRPGPPG